MNLFQETVKTLYRIQIQTGAFPGAHYIDAVSFEMLRAEIVKKHGAKFADAQAFKILDVPVRPYDLLPPV